MPVNKYESVFIAEPEISTEQVDELLSKIKTTVTGHQGSVVSEDRWGRRRLAYSIRGHREGFYALVHIAAEPTVVSALDHLYNVSGSIIRYLTVRQIEPSKKLETRRERPAKPSAGRHSPGHASGSQRVHRDHGVRTTLSQAPAIPPGHAAESPMPAPVAESPPREGDQPQ